MATSKGKLLVSVFSVIALMVLTGCGGGKGSGATEGSGGVATPAASSQTGGANAAQVVANVGGTHITRAEVNHWIAVFAGRDYYITSHHLTVPEGLVSDPPNYGRCVEQLEAAESRAPAGSERETGVRLLQKCRSLYQALRTQATTYLVSAARIFAIAREFGVVVNNSEVDQFFKQARSREYPTEAAFQRYLAATREGVADLEADAKVELLGTRILAKAQESSAKALYRSVEQRWASKVTCSPGYVVEFCEHYGAGGTTYKGTGPPSVLLEQVAALVTGHCVNLAACANQARTEKSGK